MSSQLRARHVAATISGIVRKVVENGREFIVAPIVAVKDGVLNGELVRSDVLGRLLDEWEGTPLTINHPPDDAAAVITKTHAWIRQNEIGTMRNVHVAQNRLKGEVWIPTDQTAPEVKAVIKRIENGETLQVSVGFLSAFTVQKGTFGRKQFREVTQDAAPNHVALLPNDVGACSIVDGCGTPRAASADINSNVAYDGIEATPWQQVDRSLSAFIRAAGKALNVEVDEHADVSSLTTEVKQWIAERTLLGDADATTADELLRAPVVNPATGRLNRAAVMAVFGHRTERLNIESDRKLKARQAAVALLGKNFGIVIDPRAAKESSMAESDEQLVSFPKINGARVGAVLSKVLDRSKNAAARKETIDRMATAAGVDANRVKSIAAGSEEFTEERIIKTFADVLEISPSLLFAAAFWDDDEFMRALEKPVEQVQENPMGFFSMSNAIEAFKRWTGIQTDGGQTMKRCELESRIKEAKGLTDNDAAGLKGLSDGALKIFAEGIGVDVAGFEVSGGAEPKQKKEEPTPAPAAAGGGVTLEQMQTLLKQNRDEIKTELKTELQAESKAAADAAKKLELTAAAKAKGLTDEQIAATPVEVLQQFVGQPTAGGAAVFAGAAGSAPTQPTTLGEAHVKTLVSSPDPYNMDAIKTAQQSFRQRPS